MRRNVASQVVGAQMITAADGSAFTGSVTCYVTGNAGTQAAGSVGSGACTHEGNGFHTYAPSQGETNYAHVAFTFTGTGAIPATVQVYTRDYDSSGRETVGAIASDAINAAAIASDAGTELATAVWASGTRTLTALDEDSTTLDLDATIRAAVGLASADLDTQLAALPTAAENATAVSSELGTGSGLTALATAAALAVVDENVDDLKSGIIYGAAATGTLSTTQATSDLSGYADDQLIGRVIIWLSGACEGEATDITDYASASGLLTFTALAATPGNGDTFKIV